MGLSILYVVRNEEELLKQSIASVEPIADQIVVVDTGSADGTAGSARGASRKVKVVPYVWPHDYSKARNYGLQHCDQDWVMYLDADEVIDHKTASLIRESVTSAKEHIWGFSLKILDFPGGLDSEPMEPFFPSPQIRVFRRKPEVKFEGSAMESVSRSITTAGGSVNLIPGAIKHWIWRGKGMEFATLRVKYYRKLGAILPDPDVTPAPASDRSILTAPPPRPSLAVVVVGYDCASHTRQCLSGLRRATKVPYRLIPVDNGSHDDTRTLMAEEAAEDVISFRRNEGLAKARNAALSKIMSDPDIEHICFMDNDCIPSRGCIEEMTRVLDSDEGLAAVGPVSNNAPGAQSLGRTEKPSVDEVSEEISGRNPERVDVSELANFCMLFRADVLRRVGFFDEALGGFETEDMCARLRTIGMKMAIANRAYVFHRGRATMAYHSGMDWYSIQQTAAIRFKAKWNIESDATRARKLMLEKARESVPSYIVKPRTKAPTFAESNLVPTRSIMGNPRTDIVIITYNRLDMTKPCIETVSRNTKNFHFIFVDNGSTDGTVEYLSSIPNAQLVRNEKNLGVPKARNIGLRASSAPYVVVMDNDIEVKAGWLEELFKSINSGAHIVGIEGWKLDKNWGACAKCNSPMEHFDYLGGACTLSDRRVFEVAGILDEGYSPAYYEDVEWSIRAKENGFRLAFNPTPAIHHKQHATLVHGQKDFNYNSALGASHDRFARRMRGALKVEYEKLPQRKLRILYLGMMWDYGDRNRGTSYEHDNFMPSLQQWDKTSELRHFDFVELGKVHGVNRMSEMLVKEAELFQPDAVFSVFFDEHHDPRKESLSALKRVCPAKTINWFCDSHFRYENFDSKWAPYVDFCVTTSSDAQHKYVRDGFGGKVIKSQWFASPSYRKIEGVQKDVGVSFVGQPHGDRRAVIDRLKAAGINVEIYGTGWGKRLSFDEMIMMFNRTKVNLNLNNAADARFKQIKGRNFEVPACGGFLLTGAPENLPEYYEPGKELAAFGDITDMIEKIRYYLKNDSERERIAKSGHERTMREHTFKQRLDAIFASAGLL